MTTTLATEFGQPAIEGVTPGEDDLALNSVTDMINVLGKTGVEYWIGERSALAVLHSEATWRGMLADDDPNCRHEDASCPVVKWIRDARFRRDKGVRSATELGTLAHDAFDQYALTGTKPEVEPEVQPFLDQFDEWLYRFQPEYQATEVAVYHPEFGYAGMADAFLTIEGTRFVVDYKTTRKHLDTNGKPTTPYPEQVGLQLSAYRHAQYAAVWRPRRMEKLRRRYYLLSPEERAMAQPVPTVDTGLVIHVTPQSCEAYPIQCGEDVFEAYLAVQDSARWVRHTSRTVMGDPLVEVTR